MKKLLLLMLFITTSAYSQVTMASQQKSSYSIGTGFSLSYFEGHLGVNIESLHLFRNLNRPFDNALLKVGMGVDYGIENYKYPSFNFLTSVGYLYIQDQYHEKSPISKFGAGVSIDYTLVNVYANSIGATLYIVLNSFIVGIGGGVVLPMEIEAPTSVPTPYVTSSLAVTF